MYLKFVDRGPVTVEKDEQAFLKQLDGVLEAHALLPFGAEDWHRQMVSESGGNMVILVMRPEHGHLHGTRRE